MYGWSRGVDQVVLVAVHADRPHLTGCTGLRRGLEGAEARTAGGRVDDVSACLVHAGRDLLGLVRGVEAGEVRRLGQVGHVDDDVGVDGLGPGGEAGLELLDQFGLHAADEADVVGLGLERRGGADEERALLLGEHQGGDVRLVDDRVDDREVGVGVAPERPRRACRRTGSRR